ncbi:MAG TPA: hypothetical protein PK082_01670 [Phycisphaerae bacterium]|nr:hypothetical protein [Phycisphaerae bacterium]
MTIGNGQLGTLFHVPARASSPPQVEAARKVAPKARSQAWRIVRALQACGPMTREELCALTGIPACAACGRLRELEAPDAARHALLASEPLVEKVGRKPARSGVHVWVYGLTAAGKRV